ncbi:MAG: hypothetical protein ACQKBW_05605 [Puniceicoccales bacterium]
MTVNIEKYSPRTGRLIKEDNGLVNEADLLGGAFQSKGGGKYVLSVQQSSEIVASTTTPLAAGAEYGASEPFIDVSDSAFVQLQVESLQPYDATAYTLGSLSSGVAVQVSLDGSTVYKTFPLTTANNPPNESIYFDRSYPYIRFIYTNGATPQTEFYFAASKHYVHTGAPVRSIGSAFNATALSQTTRAVIFGQPESGGDFQPVALSSNDNFIVALGDRISQTGGRAHHEVNISSPTANSTLYTVPAGWNFHVTSARVWGFNNDTANPLLANIRDGGAAGDVKGGLAIEESSTGLGGVLKSANITAAHGEPVLFETDVYWEIASGIFSGSVVLVGYLEPV